MTIRELVALVLLYRACRDADLKKRIDEMVPELKDLYLGYVNENGRFRSS